MTVPTSTCIITPGSQKHAVLPLEIGSPLIKSGSGALSPPCSNKRPKASSSPVVSTGDRHEGVSLSVALDTTMWLLGRAPDHQGATVDVNMPFCAIGV